MVTHVRDGESKDVDWIREVNNGATPAVNHLDTADMQNLVDMAAQVRIAEYNGQAAGFLLAMTAGTRYTSANYQWFQRKYPRFVYIDRVVIAPGFRRLGVGSVLYADIQSFTELNAPMLTCEVNIAPANPGSMRFHTVAGFREVGQQDTEGGSKTVSLLAMPMPAFNG